MPIPLNNNKDLTSDYSFLLNIDALGAGVSSNNSSKIVTASDRDADLLMRVWKKALQIREKTYKISSGDVSQQDFIRLKSGGFVSGDMHSCQLTAKGQGIIKVMALGESNAFLKNQKSKSYTEIMASTNKRGKKGFRIASVNGEEMENFNMTMEQWQKIGRTAGWLKESGNDMIPGQTPYTPEEQAQFNELMGGALEDQETLGINEANEDDFISRRRTVKVYFDDGDYLITGINGTKEEIKNYYENNEFVADDETTMRRVTEVFFID